MTMRIRRRDEDERGFTLTELLVVIVIIGILAAVAIPLYINQQARARDAAAQSDVSGLGREIQAQLVNIGVDKIELGVNATETNYVLRVVDNLGTVSTEQLGGISNSVVLVSETGSPVAAGAFTTLMVQPGLPTAGPDAEITRDLSERSWCINVHTPGGKDKSHRYSANGGLQTGLCAKAGTETEVTYGGGAAGEGEGEG